MVLFGGLVITPSLRKFGVSLWGPPCVLRALNAERVAGSTLEFCTWNDSSTSPTIFFPFSDNDGIFRVFKLPQRRAAEGRLFHDWSYGIRLGDKASGAWANCVSDLTQPKLPPVLRKINWRELVQFFAGPQPVGPADHH